MAPPTQRPLPRPDVTPPPVVGVSLLYAQGQQIGALPLSGTRIDKDRASVLLQLHVSALEYTAACSHGNIYFTMCSILLQALASLYVYINICVCINTL